MGTMASCGAEAAGGLGSADVIPTKAYVVEVARLTRHGKYPECSHASAFFSFARSQAAGVVKPTGLMVRFLCRQRRRWNTIGGKLFESPIRRSCSGPLIRCRASSTRHARTSTVLGLQRNDERPERPERPERRAGLGRLDDLSSGGH